MNRINTVTVASENKMPQISPELAISRQNWIHVILVSHQLIYFVETVPSCWM